MGSGTTDEIDIDSLDEISLMALNARIVERLHFLHRQKTAQALQEIKIGRRVMFDSPDGRTIRGVVIRRNRKTITVHSDDEKHWNVSPSLLRVVGGRGLDEEPSEDNRVVPFTKPGAR